MSNIIQSFWMGPRLQSLHMLSINSFLAHAHEYHLYTFDEIEDVPEGTRVLDASAICPRESVFSYQEGFGKGSYSAFSNQFRYRLLYDKGGWWVDTDVVCLKRFDFDDEFVFATEHKTDHTTTTASCVIRSPAGAEYLSYCLGVCNEKDKATLMWGEIGPRLMDDAIARFGLESHRVAPHVFNPIDYFSFGDILAADFDMSQLADSHAVHLWNQKWKSHYVDQDYDGDQGSLYAQLRRRYLPSAHGSADPLIQLRRHAAFQRACIEELQRDRDEYQYALASAQRELVGLRQQVEEQQRELRQLRDALGNAQREIEGLRNSMSWTITAPLRAAYDMLAGTKRPTQNRK